MADDASPPGSHPADLAALVGGSQTERDAIEPGNQSAAEPDDGGEGARLLAVGDVHLGRRPGGLPGGVDPTPFGPRAALASAVETALSERVDAVLFAGDVVDAARDYFEAYAPLVDAARRLLAAGIEVLCVAGNHDVRVLPRLVAEAPGVRLLGAGGRWELHVVHRGERPVARVLGWSFPRARVTESPLQSFDAGLLTRTDDALLPTVGLLHADLDAGGGPYAPVTRRALEAVGVDAWLLGHVHAPSDLSGPRPIGYLGSLSALDAGAVGRRGPWLCQWTRSGPRLRHLAQSALRFERTELDLTPLSDAEQLEEHLARAVRGAGERAAADGGEERLIGVRVRLVGRSRLRRPEREAVREAALRGLGGGSAGVGAVEGEGGGAFLEAVVDEALPAVDLARLAQGLDPLGLVARRVLALQAGDEEGLRLVRRALPILRARAEHATFSAHLETPELDEERARVLLLDAGRRTLDALLTQRPEVLEDDSVLQPAPRHLRAREGESAWLFEEDPSAASAAERAGGGQP